MVILRCKNYLRLRDLYLFSHIEKKTQYDNPVLEAKQNVQTDIPEHLGSPVYQKSSEIPNNNLGMLNCLFSVDVLSFSL